jgi:hypothetical protein
MDPTSAGMDLAGQLAGGGSSASGGTASGAFGDVNYNSGFSLNIGMLVVLAVTGLLALKITSK